MIIPWVSSFIEKTFPDLFFRDLTSHYRDISTAYREKGSLGSSLRFTEKQIRAYACARLPATVAVASAVIDRLRERYAAFQPASFLDIGSGLGSFLWAVLHYFPELQKSVLLEGNRKFLMLLKDVVHREQGRYPALKNTLFLSGNLRENTTWDSITDIFDLVSISYVLSELTSTDQIKLVENAWKKTRSVLVIAEPGTPKGFFNISQARDFLIKQGGVILGPCTHQNECPLASKLQDWCHFSVRFFRTERHKTLKGATLPFEDEKYCYLIVGKDPVALNLEEVRILKNPLKRSGHILLDVCTSHGEERVTVTKKKHVLYKNAQKKRWGDLWKHVEGD